MARVKALASCCRPSEYCLRTPFQVLDRLLAESRHQDLLFGMTTIMLFPSQKARPRPIWPL